MFEFLVNIFDTFLYRPLFNLLVLIYDYLPLHDFGLTIIFLTLIIRFILYPISVKAITSQRALQKLQPKIQEIQKEYKDDREKQAQEMLELYRREKINPFSGLFLVIIQFPVLIALYRVFWRGLKPEELSHLYSFVMRPDHINPVFLHMVNLAEPHNLLFAIAAGVLQFFQTKMLMPTLANDKKNPQMALLIQKQMIYFFPLITIAILYTLPAALSLYWIISGIFSIIQQYLILKKKDA